MVRGCRLAKRGQMATDAFGGEPEAIELANRADFVAGVTIDSGVSSEQRETILMLIDVVNGNLPSVGVVAEFTFGAVFPAMKVSMAVLALLRSIAEDEILVTVGALHFCVTAVQREFRPRMGELKFGAKWLPALCGVTVLARSVELAAVRAATVVERNVLSERNTPEEENSE